VSDISDRVPKVSRFVVVSLPDASAHSGVASMNAQDMARLGCSSGEVISISGRRSSSAIVLPSEEVEVGSIHLEATTRLNVCSRVGDGVSVSTRKKVPTLNRVVFAPVRKVVEMSNLQDLVGPNLNGRFIGKGDHITFPSPNGGVLELQAEKVGGIFSIGSGGLIGPETDVEVLGRIARRPLLDTGDVSFADIGGLDDVIKQIQEVAVVPLLHPQIFLRGGKPPIRGVLLDGEPGTGKSLLARALARETQATFHAVSAPEIVGGCVGSAEEALRDLFSNAKEQEPSVIFIDEIDSIAPDRHSSSEMSRRIVAQLLTLLDGIGDRGQVIVIGATNRIDSIDPAINRSGRFERVIECPVPDRGARLEIFEIHTRGMPLAEDVDLDELADLTVGFVGADIDHMCREGVYRAAERTFGFDRLLDIDEIEAKSLEIMHVDLVNAFSLVRPSIKRRYIKEIEEVDFDSIIGQDKAKEILKEKLLNPLSYPELYDIAGLSIGSGVLMHGPPGTGKTALARAVANVAGAQFLSVKGPELLSMWQGESERAVRTLMDKARKMSPCVIFFDEFDSLGMDRGHVGPGNSGHSSVVNQLLTEFDGIDSRDGVLVIAATNRRDLIDSAFLREGRLGSQVEVGLPERREYWQIIDSHLGDSPRSSELSLRKFCDSLPDGMSGADLAGIGKRIRENSVQRHLESNPEGNICGFMIRQEDVDSLSEGELDSVGIEAWT
tara:strand:- start:7100 stop:9265 length:2166 start_codon:yes stop_codon:yes gene_type:complete